MYIEATLEYIQGVSIYNIFRQCVPRIHNPSTEAVCPYITFNLDLHLNNLYRWSLVCLYSAVVKNLSLSTRSMLLRIL